MASSGLIDDNDPPAPTAALYLPGGRCVVARRNLYQFGVGLWTDARPDLVITKLNVEFERYIGTMW